MIIIIVLIIGVFVWVLAVELLRMKSWAYTLAVILAAVSLLSFPLGTIFGTICIWMLLKEKVKKAYGKALSIIQA